MKKNITIKKAQGTKLIVEYPNAAPKIYDSVTEIMLNETFYDEVNEAIQDKGNVTLLIEVTINPPISK